MRAITRRIAFIIEAFIHRASFVVIAATIAGIMGGADFITGHITAANIMIAASAINAASTENGFTTDMAL